MAETLVTRRAAEALKRAGGNAKLAQRLLIEQAGRDQTLLAELVRPHLAAIAAQAIARVGGPAAGPRRPRQLSAEGLDGVIAALGRNFPGAEGAAAPRPQRRPEPEGMAGLVAAALSGARPGPAGSAPAAAAPRPAASAGQAAVFRMIAAAQKQRRRDTDS